MEYSFLDIINMLNQNLPQSDNFAFRLARAALQPDTYLFNRLLPRENRPDWHVTGGTMTITPTILGDVAMDSPYPPMGNLQSSAFLEKISKFGGQMFFTEQQQRELINMINALRVTASMDNRDAFGDFDGQMRMFAERGSADNNTINGRRINTIFGIIRSITKSHWDTGEWLSGEALTEGKINYTFNDLEMDIDYDVPAANIDDYAGNDRFDQSASKWWTWVKKVHTKLDNPTFFLNSNSYYDITENDVNKIETLDITGMERRIRRYRDDAIVQKRDARESMTVNVYNKAGSIMDVTTKTLISKPFLKDKRVIAIGGLNPDAIELNLGGVTDPDNELALGYNHIGPTIEGGGRPGIWARIFTPEGKPMQILAETAANMLPMIYNPKRLMIAKFD